MSLGNREYDKTKEFTREDCTGIMEKAKYCRTRIVSPGMMTISHETDYDIDLVRDVIGDLENAAVRLDSLLARFEGKPSPHKGNESLAGLLGQHTFMFWTGTAG